MKIMIPPEFNPAFAAAKIGKKQIHDYHSKIFQAIADLEEPQIDLEDLAKSFPVAIGTFKKHLKQFINIYPELLLKLTGFYPDVGTIVDIAESQPDLGKINSGNLMEANVECKKVVDVITKPRHVKFLSHHFDKNLGADGATLTIDKMALIDLLYDRYVEFIHEADNGLVSIVGRLNEEIFLRAMSNGGMVYGKDFVRTGQNSEADIIVFQNGGNKNKLYVEVKSYHARERLLRGLQDINQPEKIGIGFFIDKDEFNPLRTATLLESNARAIYLPDVTYAAIGQSSKEMTTVLQHRFYRPLSKLVDDMLYFVNHGKVRPFP